MPSLRCRFVLFCFDAMYIIACLVLSCLVPFLTSYLTYNLSLLQLALHNRESRKNMHDGKDCANDWGESKRF